MPVPIFIVSGIDSIKRIPDLIEKNDVALLFNVPNLLRGDAPLRDANAIIDAHPFAKVIVDSGGKQIAEIVMGGMQFREHIPDGNKPIRVGRTLHLAPEHLGQAIRKLLRVNILMSLDDPVIPNNDPFEQSRTFESKLARNVNWTEKTVAMRNHLFPDVQVFMPAQCFSVEQFERLWTQVKSFKLDGISLPGRCFRHAEDLFPFLKRFNKIGIQRFHFLGSSRLEIVALLCFLGRQEFFEHLAFDSTTWMQEAIRGKLILPYTLRAVAICQGEFESIKTELADQDRVFRQYDIHDIPKMSAAQQRQCLRTLNVYAITKTKCEIYENAGSPAELEDFLLRRLVPAITAHKIRHLIAQVQTINRG